MTDVIALLCWLFSFLMIGVATDTLELAALLDVKAVAALLDCSPQHVRRLADAGRMPRPLKLGALLRWRRSDLDEWLADGCPSWLRPT